MYCPHCGIWVAPYDPEMLLIENEVWHRACLAKELQEQVKEKIALVVDQRSPVQLTLFVQ